MSAEVARRADAAGWRGVISERVEMETVDG
jgi:hypothetical protein